MVNTLARGTREQLTKRSRSPAVAGWDLRVAARPCGPLVQRYAIENQRQKMYQRFIWPISITFGVCVALLVLWVTASLIEAEPSNLQDQTDRSSVQLIGTRSQCTTKTTELNRAISNSRSCLKDNDCVLVMDSSLTFGQCFISVQNGQAGLVSAKLEETKMNCRHSSITACGHSTASAICKDNVCAVENFDARPLISLHKLKQQTMKSINENLQ